SNRIDGSREAGTQRLLVTADGRRLVLANAIEMPRLRNEVLPGLDFEPVEYAWTDDQDPAYSVAAARKIVGGSLPLGADWPLPETSPSAPSVTGSSPASHASSRQRTPRRTSKRAPGRPRQSSNDYSRRHNPARRERSCSPSRLMATRRQDIQPKKSCTIRAAQPDTA